MSIVEPIKAKVITQSQWFKLFTNENRPYYTVLGKKFYNKLLAMIESKKISAQTNLSVWQILKFNCFDSLANVDFSIEPAESYEELRGLRAAQLRQKYEYIRLWYSGGPDSHTTLKAFYESNSHIDELVVVRNSSIGQDAPSNVETKLLVEPNIPKIRAMFPNTKITILEHLFDVNANVDIDSSDFFDSAVKSASQVLLCRSMSATFDYYPELQDAYKYNMCELTGEPKPNLICKDGKWYTYIIDNQIETILTLPNVEMFHFSPDFPQLYIKQCHMLKRHFLSLLADKAENFSLGFNNDADRKNVFLERYNEWDDGGYTILQHRYSKVHNSNGDAGVTLYTKDLMQNDTYFEKFLHKLRNSYFQIFDNHTEFYDKKGYFHYPTGLLSLFWCIDENKTLSVDELFPLGFGRY